MTRFVIHYDIAALIIIITTMLNFFCKKNVHTKKSNLFSLVIIFAFFLTIFDLMSCYTISNYNGFPEVLNLIINHLYLIALNSTGALYTAYIILNAKNGKEINWYDKLILILPITLDIILILSNNFTNYIFYFDKAGYYHQGKYMPILYLNYVIYILYSICIVLKYKKRFNFINRIPVYFYSILYLFTVIFEMKYSNILIIPFVISVSCLLIYLALENPENYFDKVTGVYNRSAFVEIMKLNIEKGRKNFTIGVQIKGMKYIADALGNENENKVLKEIANYFVEISGLKNVFYVSEYTFVILINSKDGNHKEIIKKIKDRFSHIFEVSKIGFSLDSAICVVDDEFEIERPDDLLASVEYSIKNCELYGDNSIIVYADKASLEKGRRENQILHIVKDAIKKEKFEVYFQPIYDNKKKAITSAEAIIRLFDDKFGQISSEEFIVLSERNGLIVDIGNIVLKKVCQFINKYRIWEMGIEKIDVNLSVVQCMKDDLYVDILNIIKEYNIPKGMVNFEITETATYISKNNLKNNMEMLKKEGISFAMDDFGTGFANMNSIIEFPFDIIKIDKSMLWLAMESEKSMCILRYMIDMLKAMNLKIIVEGIETTEHIKLLEKLGCNYFQGYFFSKPINENDFVKFIKEKEFKVD